ncbi:MAG: hypothetical protein JWQ14_2798 [Adhaeribacter sp.]|nr:hypothetical protein [Adhaeribacter sp.]
MQLFSLHKKKDILATALTALMSRQEYFKPNFRLRWIYFFVQMFVLVAQAKIKTTRPAVKY